MKKNSIGKLIQLGCVTFLAFFSICGFFFEIEDTVRGKFDLFGYGLSVVLFFLSMAWYGYLGEKLYPPTSKKRFIPNTLYVLAVLMLLYGLTGKDWISGIGMAVAFGFAGLMISTYQDGTMSKEAANHKEAKRKVSEQKKVLEKPGKEQKQPKIISVLSQLQAVSSTKTAQERPEFFQTVSSCEALLKALEKSNKRVPEYLLNNMEAVNGHYLNFERNTLTDGSAAPVKTDKVRAMTEKLIQSYSLFEEALENLYDKSFEDQSLEILSDIEVLEQKLEMDGLLDSDFEVKPSSKISS